MRPVDKNLVKLKTHISKEIMLRLLMFIAIVAGAVVFDMCHDQVPEQVVNQTQDTAEHQFDRSQVVFCNPVSSFKLRTGSDRLISKLLFSKGQDRFLSAYHNQKAYHVLKAESLKERSPQNAMIHFLEFMICHHASSDDNPPIA
ncbi:hypothetical protein [Sunxiuqinia sp. sy24]|uniref:hypothetical protein n=1 Tax=Sunxiuqinia sp. sy24 TaxID=3461495 RepID=UPI00404560FF